MAFEENKHPRDKGGKFTTKGNKGSKEYRQNTDYKQILEDKYNSELPGKPVEAFGFANKERLNTKDHVQHAKDMGFKNQKEYELFACEFWNNGEGIVYKGTRRNNFAKYDAKSKYYVVLDKNGFIKTFYKIDIKKFKKIIKQEGYNEWKK